MELEIIKNLPYSTANRKKKVALMKISKYIRHIKENNKSKMPWIFFIRQGSRLYSEWAY